MLLEICCPVLGWVLFHSMRMSRVLCGWVWCVPQHCVRRCADPSALSRVLEFQSVMRLASRRSCSLADVSRSCLDFG